MFTMDEELLQRKLSQFPEKMQKAICASIIGMSTCLRLYGLWVFLKDSDTDVTTLDTIKSAKEDADLEAYRKLLPEIIELKDGTLLSYNFECLNALLKFITEESLFAGTEQKIIESKDKAVKDCSTYLDKLFKLETVADLDKSGFKGVRPLSDLRYKGSIVLYNLNTDLTAQFSEQGNIYQYSAFQVDLDTFLKKCLMSVIKERGLTDFKFITPTESISLKNFNGAESVAELKDKILKSLMVLPTKRGALLEFEFTLQNPKIRYKTLMGNLERLKAVNAQLKQMAVSGAKDTAEYKEMYSNYKTRTEALLKQKKELEELLVFLQKHSNSSKAKKGAAE